VTFGDLRHHGGTTWDLNWAFLAVSGSTRRSFTRGGANLDGPDDDLDRAWPGMAVTGDTGVAVLVTLAGELGQVSVDLGLEGRGEHRASSVDRSRPASTARPRGPSHRSLRSALACLPRRRSTAGFRLVSIRKVRRVSGRVADPQLQVIPPTSDSSSSVPTSTRRQRAALRQRGGGDRVSLPPRHRPRLPPRRRSPPAGPRPARQHPPAAVRAPDDVVLGGVDRACWPSCRPQQIIALGVATIGVSRPPGNGEALDPRLKSWAWGPCSVMLQRRTRRRRAFKSGGRSVDL